MAGRLIVEWTPFDATGIDDPAVAATWSSLTVRAIDDNRTTVLTRVLDRHAKSERHEVFGSVLPLAEWIARCWHALFSARHSRPSRLAPRRVRSTWDRTHRWRWCSEGTALPDLEFVRLGDDSFECRWTGSSGDEADEYERVLFLTHGTVEVSSGALRRTLADFVTSVLARLEAVAPGNARAQDLQRIWAMAQDPQDPAFEPIRFSARLGAHWWSLRDEERRSLAGLAKDVSNPIADAGLDAVSEASLRAWLRMADRIWQDCERASEPSPAWPELRRSVAVPALVTPSGMKPWDRGRAAARRLRDHFARSSAEPWDAAEATAQVDVLAVPGANDFAKSVIGWSAGRRPVIARRELRAPKSELFAGVRDLYPLLFLGRVDRPYGCVLSDRIAGALPVANAFATELLAPIERVRRALGGRDRVGAEDLEEIALEIGAPILCVQHQVENHRLAEFA